MAAKNEAKVRFSADTKGFNDQIKAANQEMAELRSELKLNEAQMKANGVSVEGLQEKQKNLTAQMEAAQDKTIALSQKVAKAAEIFGENSDEVSKLRIQLKNAQTAEVNLQRALSDCNAELEQQERAANHVETASEKLSGEIADQRNEVDRLKQEYVDAVLEFGEASDEAKALAEKIDDLSGELKDNKKRMEDASRAADEMDRSLDDAEDRDPSGFTVLKGAMADLVSEGIQAVIGSVKDMLSYFAGLPQETMELRQDFGTLTTAFDNVGLGAETATETWKELYKVFGEDDRAVETANNIARIADNEKELNDWVTITTGIWGTYQDSLPVEGLAEAAAETAKTGTVTGGLADALNWSSEAAVMFADYMSEDVVTAEDAFNEALAACTTEEERQALITDTLTKLYGGAADTYRDTTSAQMEAKEASAETMLAEANLAAAIEPVTTEWTNMKNELLTGILPVVEDVCGWLKTTMEWLQEHPVALKILASVLGVVAAALVAFTIATTAQTVAQWALNSAILANPITWIIVAIVAAIAAVIAIIVLMIEYWDEIVAAVTSAVDSVKAALGAAVDWINTNVIQPIGEFFSGLWDGIKNAFSGVGEWFGEQFRKGKENAQAAWQNTKQFFSNVWEGTKNVFANIGGWFGEKFQQGKESAINAFSNVKSLFSNVVSNITSAFANVKEKLSAPFEKARDAIKGVVDKIKGFFSGLSLKFPNIPLPHFGIKPKGWKIGDLLEGSIPSLSIQWYKDGGIMTKPTIFGVNGNSLMAGGEAGAEAILPIDRLEGYIAGAIEKSVNVAHLGALAAAVQDLANRPISINVNGRELALATASDTDVVNGNRMTLSRRGLAL